MFMEINDALISKLEKLSKLQLSEEEKGVIKNDLTNILGMIDKIQEVDTSGVNPLRHITEETDVLRNDQAENEISREEALKNAPSTDGTYIQVPKVIDL